MRLIDADTLEKHKYDNIEKVTPNESAIWQQGWNDAIDAIMNYALTVDAEPVRHGHWKGKPIAGYSDVRCSNCGDVFMENTGKWNYCPNCGARMDGNK